MNWKYVEIEEQEEEAEEEEDDDGYELCKSDGANQATTAWIWTGVVNLLSTIFDGLSRENWA